MIDSNVKFRFELRRLCKQYDGLAVVVRQGVVKADFRGKTMETRLVTGVWTFDDVISEIEKFCKDG